VAKYRNGLPQLGRQVFLTDTGLETTLIYRDGYELPSFASFVLLENQAGREHISQYYRRHASIAQSVGAGFIFESVGWRASKDWGEQIGYSPAALDKVNRDSIALMAEVQREFDSPAMPTVLSGCIGPRGDAYNPTTMMTEQAAAEYHIDQIRTFCDTDADMISALTISYDSEAIGIVRAAASVEMPVAISFTVETDGRLPSGMMLSDAIRSVDEATDAAAAYFMINCAYPTHFEPILVDNADWAQRIRGVRANASRKSHAELDESEELDAGDPDELAEEYVRLRERFSTLTVLGGCCGTDERHLQKIGLTCVSPLR
jgi:S-methylmethionine-dependent homocysteine/selenocysteine methylase